jgi:hypothetical protein
MNGQDDPMNGSPEERDAYLRQISDMIDQDIEQRRAQRLAEFQQTREQPAVLLGSTGGQDSIIQSID